MSGKAKTGCWFELWPEACAEDADLPRDVFELLIPKILESKLQLSRDHIVHGAGDIQASRRSHLFKARRNVHALTEHVAVFTDDDVAEAHAHSELNPVVHRIRVFAVLEFGPDRERGLKCLERAIEFRQESVACRLDQPPRMSCERRLDNLAQEIPHAAEHAFLVAFHEAGKAHDVSREDDGEPARRLHGEVAR